MFSFHKPKIYRSITGCCICRAKSSSSRFTDSKKYEIEFERCFKIHEKRAGEICNACVLLVKRWKKLPVGTNRHWNHVVDARAGPGTKSALKFKNKNPGKHKHKSKEKLNHIYDSSPDAFYDDAEDDISNKYLRKRMHSLSDDSDNEDVCSRDILPSKHKRKVSPSFQVSPFLDLSYWKKTQICCGIIFKGQNGEVLVDPQLIRPCFACRNKKSETDTIKDDLSQSQSTDTETESNASNPSFPDIEYSDSINGDADSEQNYDFSDLSCTNNKIIRFSQRELPLEC